MTDRKSILHQLSKYKPTAQETAIVNANKNELTTSKEEMSISKVAMDLGVLPKDLARVPYDKYTNVLYPFKLSCIYHLVRSGRYYPGAENRCNSLIQDFMNRRIANLGYEGYFNLFKNALTPRIQRLVMLRVLVASFGIGPKKMDIVPASLRNKACEHLNLCGEATHELAMDMIEKEYPESTLEEQILGRLGYLMIWKNLCGLEALALPYKP